MNENVYQFRVPQPRSEIVYHRGIRVQIKYDVPNKTWTWTFTHTVFLNFDGRAKTFDAAVKEARKKIDSIMP